MICGEDQLFSLTQQRAIVLQLLKGGEKNHETEMLSKKMLAWQGFWI